MKCKHCGKTKEAHFDGHCEYGPYKFEPAEPEIAAQKVEQPAVEPQKVCMCAGTCLGEIKDCPRAGSTRPEMPPVETEYERGWNAADDAAHEYLEKMGVARDGRGLYLRLDSLAASVQQEPLSADGEKLATVVLDMLNKDKVSTARIHLRAYLDALKSQPAAPRTQGREPLDEEVAQEFRAATNEDKGNNG